MSRIRPHSCAAPGPYAAHCTEPPGHRHSCYDAGEDVSFDGGQMVDLDLEHDCGDATCANAQERSEGAGSPACSRKSWCKKRDGHQGACYPFHDPDRSTD